MDPAHLSALHTTANALEGKQFNFILWSSRYQDYTFLLLSRRLNLLVQRCELAPMVVYGNVRNVKGKVRLYFPYYDRCPYVSPLENVFFFFFKPMQIWSTTLPVIWLPLMEEKQMQTNLDCKLLVTVLYITFVFLMKSSFIMRARQRITV